MPCGFGFTSPEGACGPEECYPTDQCPAGTQPTDETLDFGGPHTAKECVCKPGFGAVVGEGACHLCPSGTFSRGGSMEDCVPCPFGYTSAPGTTSWKGCVPAAQECPVGQLAPLGAVSKDECGCLPGHGGELSLTYSYQALQSIKHPNCQHHLDAGKVRMAPCVTCTRTNTPHCCCQTQILCLCRWQDPSRRMQPLPSRHLVPWRGHPAVRPLRLWLHQP